jgi:uncharacterized protein
MLKRKYGDRADWTRILKRRYAQTFLNTSAFTGHITLLHTVEVSAPLTVTYGDKELCIVDNGYMWLQQFPLEKHHSVTTMFNHNGEIVQWYIDICLENSIEQDRPYMDDLFLDLIILPTGEIIEKDANELDEALSKGSIDQLLYDLAWNEANDIKQLLHKQELGLLPLSTKHKDTLAIQLK